MSLLGQQVLPNPRDNHTDILGGLASAGCWTLCCFLGGRPLPDECTASQVVFPKQETIP